MEVTLYFLQLLLQVAVEVVQVRQVLLAVLVVVRASDLLLVAALEHQVKVIMVVTGVAAVPHRLLVAVVAQALLALTVHLEILEDKAVMVLRRSMA
jgi:hypothetical protein